ncbi:MAG: helix-turn-helix transcriptional regulator [Candidatus Omnitrophica bacterium]|nr:helix-turn-helix transcriptional regulator [Candidatus Omnitrophota bacterium]
MLPFNQTVLLWRLRRGLTQAALAQKAHIPRPNLSAIEQGRREVSLGTLRSLALALDVRPGILVDGMAPAPASGALPSLSRRTIERIADAVAFDRSVTEPTEQRTVEALQMLLALRTRAARRQWSRPRISRRRTLAAWAQLTHRYGRTAIQMFADRVLERQRA